MTDDDIRAFGPPLTAAPTALPRHKRRWPWLLFGALVLLLLVAGLTAALLDLAIDTLDRDTTISIDGQRWQLASLHGAHLLGAVIALLVTALVALVVVPLVVLLALLGAALGIGVALLALLGVMALALSPLWMLVLLLWLLLRPARRAPSSSA
jgi:hypothetical protein